MSKNYLSKNDELRRGDCLVSNNGAYKAIFQDDGNFVIYGWTPTWATDTWGSDTFRLCMQPDCNLVMYNQSGAPRWSTGTCCDYHNMCRLQLTDDGHLVLCKGAQELWSSATSKAQK